MEFQCSDTLCLRHNLKTRDIVLKTFLRIAATSVAEQSASNNSLEQSKFKTIGRPASEVTMRTAGHINVLNSSQSKLETINNQTPPFATEIFKGSPPLVRILIS